MNGPIRCHDCGQYVERHGTEWWDDIGIGCTGRGEWGEVLMHRPNMVQVDSFPTFQVVTYHEGVTSHD